MFFFHPCDNGGLDDSPSHAQSLGKCQWRGARVREGTERHRPARHSPDIEITTFLSTNGC